ncbi:HD-GYP domain-containing protein [Methylorubrum extorquens]|uniref:HD-GYP domain-containing protein n=1 Tax=Methylorubrum extorquens TaxID=408 RepID=UPI001EE55B53|nr:HD domain-containing phosphohydrolase [Methylorubrum extorquens]MCG5248327.1 HD domain-containing protein [Methylorubrum extorquens]
MQEPRDRHERQGVQREDVVVLVSDRRERAERLARGIALVLPCRVVEPGAALPADRPIAFVVDLATDLAADRGSAWIMWLAERIRESGLPCLYLARGNAVQDTAAVRLLGTPTVIDPRQSAGIVPTLIRLVAEGKARGGSSDKARKPGGVPPELRVERATTLVTRLFDKAATGRPPSPEEAEEGTRIVLDTVSEVGIRTWLDLVWRHDIQVYQHSLSVAGFAAAFAAELGFSRGDRQRLAKAALLHDVGKALIPHAILNKPGPLTPDEMRVMRTHAALGADLLAQEGAFEPEILDVVRYHHERLDGSGYPEGLKGARISDLVRLVAICDVHSALTERRVYRPPLPAAEAAAIMQAQAGQLDPDLLRVYRPIIFRAGDAAGGPSVRS